MTCAPLRNATIQVARDTIIKTDPAPGIIMNLPNLKDVATAVDPLGHSGPGCSLMFPWHEHLRKCSCTYLGHFPKCLPVNICYKVYETENNIVTFQGESLLKLTLRTDYSGKRSVPPGVLRSHHIIASLHIAFYSAWFIAISVRPVLNKTYFRSKFVIYPKYHVERLLSVDYRSLFNQ